MEKQRYKRKRKNLLNNKKESIMKRLVLSATLMMAGMSAFAGGLLTNTNQNAAYLRNFAQEGQITLTSLYANPAGNAFLSKGWHVSINNQSAFQERNIETTFPLFPLNADNHDQTHKFKGTAKAPAIPSFTVSHNWDRWSLSAHFALSGGGGKCEFDKGLGSFEALYGGQAASNIITAIATNFANTQGATLIPQYMAGGMTQEQAYAQLQQDAAAYGMSTFGANPSQYLNAYSMNSYMKGRSYYFGLQVGASYKITDNVSGYLGVRGVYATCNYNGWVEGFKVAAMGAPLMDQNKNLDLNCDQTGFGLAPIVGLDWMINDKWNVAIKYEAAARMSLKNKTQMSEVALQQAADPTSPLHDYQDGKKVRGDIPAILALGAEYSPIKTVRIDASFKTYFEKSAADRDKMEDLGNTLEACLGVEYDVHKFVTLSASWQSTNYKMEDAYMNDISFNLSSNSLGFGVRLHPTKLFNIDLGYMHTFYQDRTVTTQTLLGPKTDKYNRKNKVFGIGFNFAI